MTASEKVAYLKGLAEGMGMDPEKNEGKLFKAVIDVLEDLAYGQEELEDSIEEVCEGLDAVSDDLADVEDYLFGEEDDECCDCGDDCDCDECDCDDCDDDYDYSVVCPSCNEELLITEDEMEAGVIECPCCGETLELEFDEDEENEEPDEE